MSDHSIEELERQHQAAKDRLLQASKDVMAAADRIQEARNEASGIVGHILEFARTRGYGSKRKTLTYRIIVDKVAPYWGQEIYAFGRRILTDGSVGVTKAYTKLSDAADLGPYVEPKP